MQIWSFADCLAEVMDTDMELCKLLGRPKLGKLGLSLTLVV